MVYIFMTMYFQNFPNRKIKIYVSFVEIYQEVIKDLLNPESSNLHVIEDPCVRYY